MSAVRKYAGSNRSEEAIARYKETMRARQVAYRALKAAHPEEYQWWYREALAAEVAAR